MSARAFRIQPGDNVATLLDEAAAGATVQVLGGDAFIARQAIARAHKIALGPVAAGAPVVKFGVPIGRALAPIAPGDWVHLHNLASNHDGRSGSLDLQTGAPTDTAKAYA